MCKLQSTNIRDYAANVYPPKSNFSEGHISAPRGCCAPKFLHALENDQVNAFEFGPRDFDAGKILPPNFLQSDLWRRADSRWALPHISRLVRPKTIVFGRTYVLRVKLNKGDNASTTFKGDRPLKIWECKKLQSTNIRDYAANVYPPKSNFSEGHISAHKRCCAPKFLHALKNHQVLLAHFPPKTGAPLQLFSKGSQKLV